MSAILGTILKLLGLGNGASVINKGVGIATNLALLPFITWLLANAEKQINFQTSLGFLALIGAFIYVLLEVARRSNPHQGE